MSHAAWFLSASLVWLLSCTIEGAKVLVIPTPVPSHMLYCNAISEALLARGHDMHFLVPDGIPRQVIINNTLDK